MKTLIGRNTKSYYKTKYKIMTGTQKIAQNTLNKHIQYSMKQPSKA